MSILSFVALPDLHMTSDINADFLTSLPGGKTDI